MFPVPDGPLTFPDFILLTAFRNMLSVIYIGRPSAKQTPLYLNSDLTVVTVSFHTFSSKAAMHAWSLVGSFCFFQQVVFVEVYIFQTQLSVVFKLLFLTRI